MAIENIGLYPITIDVYKKHKATTVKANDNDINGRGLLITLVKDDIPFDSRGINLRIGFRNAIGEERLYDCEVVNALSGTFKVFYPTEMLAGNGGRVVKLEIKAYEGTGALLNYAPLFVYVNASEVSDGALSGTSEASALFKAITEYESIGGQYLAAENSRDGQYEAAELNRDQLYSANEQARDSLYSSAESGRDALYQTEEGARNTQYNSSEIDRNIQYANAESARDTLYQTAESNRDSLLNHVNAQLNEKALKAEVGLLSELLTTAKTSLVTAINELFNSKANKAQEAWITPTLVNGWIELDTSRTPKYMKDQFGFVHLKGCVKSGTLGTSIFFLPVGYRPENSFNAFPVISNGLLGTCLVQSGGAVQAGSGNNLNFYLDGITFKGV